GHSDRGWAIESRVYAEDPFKNFGLPSVGRLSKYIEPNHLPGVRCDSGVAEGSDISIYYDPMICKLVAYGNSRQEAIARSLDALDSYVIHGVTHNIPLLRDILTEPRFVSGDITTNYLPEVYPDGFQGHRLEGESLLRLAALSAVIHVKHTQRSSLVSGHHALQPVATKWDLVVLCGPAGDVPLTVEAVQDGYQVTVEGRSLLVADTFNLAQPVISTAVDGERRWYSCCGAASGETPQSGSVAQRSTFRCTRTQLTNTSNSCQREKRRTPAGRWPRRCPVW
ncbi:propionyl-CoA carboxylase alpha chain, mitochondrial-like, partial [Amphibalanus amphitrite]|uniref:propionyl-CoA carboxylase alpha chain, mitochondrial-like n=1 Tax=Amphibalanus amphitrite TaxID=1232801 RepID=UPI001C929D5B